VPPVSGRVVVLGSVNVDLTVRAPRLPGPGETVLGASFSRAHGGKGANQAVAAARAGGAVWLCGAVGTDAFGDEALEALANEGVNVERVARVDEATGTAIIIVDDAGENEIVVVPGANALARAGELDWLPDDVAAAVLEVPVDAVEPFFAQARAAGARTVLNAAPAAGAARRLLSLTDVLCVNEGELEALDLEPRGAHPDGTMAVVTTLGRRGIRLVDGGGAFSVPGHPVPVVDTVGAGDAACGVLAAGLAEGRPLRDAVVRANAAAAMAVRGAGARTSPTRAELDRFLEAPAEGEA
jgi:ribokinase